jgi:SAM-dependent methyltransferase
MDGERRYLFGTPETDLETRRLDRLERFLDPITFDRLDRLGVDRGSRCLEVGAGRGSVALYLLAACGAGGEVVATDIDTRWIDTLTHPNVNVIRHDIVADAVDQLGQFDIVHVRLVLHHLGVEGGTVALQRLVRLLAPGGRILVEEPLVNLHPDPRHPAAATYTAFSERWYDFITTFGLDMTFGARVPSLLQDAGCERVTNDLRGFLTTAGDPFNEWLVASAATIGPALAAVFDDGGRGYVGLFEDASFWSTSWTCSGTSATRPGQ